MNYHTVTEVQRLLRKRRSYVLRLIDSGLLEAVELSHQDSMRRDLRVSSEALDRFLSRQRVGVETRKVHRGLPAIDEIV